MLFSHSKKTRKRGKFYTVAMVKLTFYNIITLIIIFARSNIMYHFSTLNYAQVPLVLPGAQMFVSACCWNWLWKIWKQDHGMASECLKFIPSFAKMRHMFSNLKWGNTHPHKNTHTHTHTQTNTHTKTHKNDQR
jgi:hypothetical protein